MMTLPDRGDRRYGERQADIREELSDYGQANGYLVDHFADARCQCGCRTFELLVDDTEGVAVRVCADCESAHPMGDSADYVDDATPEGCACACGGTAFEITVGVSLYAKSTDVRWLYVGGRCVACGMVGCYGDWKNEYSGYHDLLRRI